MTLQIIWEVVKCDWPDYVGAVLIWGVLIATLVFSTGSLPTVSTSLFVALCLPLAAGGLKCAQALSALALILALCLPTAALMITILFREARKRQRELAVASLLFREIRKREQGGCAHKP